MNLRRVARIGLYFVLTLTVSIGIAALYYRHVQHRRSGEAQRLLDKADELAWNYQWALAEPVYKQAQIAFEQKGDVSRALYAEVSQTIAHAESGSIPDTIVQLPKTWLNQEPKTPKPSFASLLFAA